VNLHERIGSIKSNEDLADFVEALRSDLEVRLAPEVEVGVIA
jgi:hypothetical protein